MSLDALVEIAQSGKKEDWQERNRAAFEQLFGAPTGRYPQTAKDEITVRAPEMRADDGVPFAAYIHRDNPPSGAYSGLSFVMFPVDDAPCLVGLVTGTQGLGQDEGILGRPGHARQVQAISAWLNANYGQHGRVAWAKGDPTRTDIKVPEAIQREWTQYAAIFRRYGGEMYALFAPNGDPAATRHAISALLDLMMRARGYQALKSASRDEEQIRAQWFRHLLPATPESDVSSLLKQRRFVILQGPPGTGKTRMALSLLRDTYGGFGRTVQFHPNTTYETFIGGLAPSHAAGELGLQFRPTPGTLIEAARQARHAPDKTYLLHIDEINRADLAKILGEAILLLESGSDQPRSVALPYDFGEPFDRSLCLPENLHILGTMNTADRSIAIVDVAVRRRFGFVSLWPNSEVVQEGGSELGQKAFRDLLDIFVEYAADDAFQLLPGHSYFLEKDDRNARLSLKTNLAPLLEEYLSQGYVTSFAEQIRTYLQWLRSL